ncbi:MAG: hypothetical protein RJA83_852 [Pseudomonadota bacterium]|jgi:hypothetical protein
MMDNHFYDQELPEISFEFSHHNQDNIIISYGPKNGFLWRGEEADPNNLLGSLNKVFETGFTQGNEHSPLAKLPYIQSYPDFICASNTYWVGEEKEFFGFDSEQASAGVYGYVYLIDTSKKNMQSIPLYKGNLDNPMFVASYIGEQISEGPDYAIISKVDPKYIIGAMPSESIASTLVSTLDTKEKIFIQNPAYKGIFCCEKIKELIGEEFSLIVPERLRISSNLPIAEEHINQQASLGASFFQNRGSVIFPRSDIDKPPETYKSPHP